MICRLVVLAVVVTTTAAADAPTPTSVARFAFGGGVWGFAQLWSDGAVEVARLNAPGVCGVDGFVDGNLYPAGPADVDRNGSVDVDDLVSVIVNFGTQIPEWARSPQAVSISDSASGVVNRSWSDGTVDILAPALSLDGLIWGECVYLHVTSRAVHARPDINGDGVVDVNDIVEVILAWSD